MILEAKQLSKTYEGRTNSLTVLNAVTFGIAAGETVAIVGPSGSGKTTLLGLCAGLDRSTAGSIVLCGKKLEGLTEDQRAALRNENVGFIFQNFQLIPTLTAIENVTIPLELQGMSDAQKNAAHLLARVGLQDRAHHYPSELSGGEQQRVSIARAFSGKPKILFADEPTGNLDDDTGRQIENLLFELNAESGATLVIVTHDLDLAQKTGRIIKLKGGLIVEDQKVSN